MYQTKKLTVYGRRAQRVVPDRVNTHFANTTASRGAEEDLASSLSSSEEEEEDEYKDKQTLKIKATTKRNTTSKSAEHRKPSTNFSKSTPLRKPLATFQTNIPRTPVKLVINTKPIKKSGKLEHSKLLSSPYVDVDITVIDEQGHQISQEHRVTRKDISAINHNKLLSNTSEKSKVYPIKKPKRARRTTTIPTHTPTDSDYVNDDDDYIPQRSSKNKRENIITHIASDARKTKDSTQFDSELPSKSKKKDQHTHKPESNTSHAGTAEKEKKKSNQRLSSDINQDVKNRGTDTSASKPQKREKVLEVVIPKASSSRVRPTPGSKKTKDSIAKDVQSSKDIIKTTTSAHQPADLNPHHPQPRKVTPIETGSKSTTTSSTKHDHSKTTLSEIFSLNDEDISMDEELILALKVADMELGSVPDSRGSRSSKGKSGTTSSQVNRNQNMKSQRTTQRTHVPSFLRPLLSECGQLNPFDFTNFIETIPADPIINFSDRSGFSESSSRNKTENSFQKVAEASYSEVFGIGNVVLKVVPLFDEDNDVSATWTADWESPSVSEAIDVLREIQVTRAMGELCKGFIKLLKAYVVQGPYPKSLLRLWDSYERKKGSLNVRPDHFSSLQTYAIIILPNGGPDLESFSFSAAAANPGSGWTQACSIFWQVAKSVSRAEELVHFEHRDLHWGQILVHYSSKLSRLHGLKMGEKVYMDDLSHGVQSTIIDLGLARIDPEGQGDDTAFWTPFTDDIFEGEGDYQYDIYRMMREGNNNKWESFNPITNIMWLHYLVDKLMHQKQLKVPSRPRGRPSRMSLVLGKAEGGADQAELRAYECLVEIERLLGTVIVPFARSVGSNPKRKAKSDKNDLTSIINNKEMKSATDVVEYGKRKGWII